MPIESSKLGNRHHQYLRMTLAIRPRLGIIPREIQDLSFCFDEEKCLNDCVRNICLPGGEVIKGFRSLRDLIAMEPRIGGHKLLNDDVVECLRRHLFSEDHSVQIQAALILPRLPYCSVLVTKDIITVIITVLKKLFLEGHNLMRYEAMRTLRFIAAADAYDPCLAILDSDILEVLRKHFHKLRLQEGEVIIQCANFLSALCCRYPQLPQNKKEVVLDTIKSLFKSIDIEGVMPAVCCAFYHLSYHRDMLVEENVIKKLVRLASYRYSWIAIPALMVVGNIVRDGQDQQIQTMMIGKDILDCLWCLLDNKSKLLQREACWILSNLAATNRMKMSRKQLVTLCSFLKDEASDVQIDTAWAIFNHFTSDFTAIKWPIRESTGILVFMTRKRKRTCKEL